MQTKFKMVPKTSHTPKTKCLAVFSMDNRWPLKYRVRILGLPRILLRKADLLFNESIDNSKEDYCS